MKKVIATIISTHTPLARRDTRLLAENKELKISTHTPLARRDKKGKKNARQSKNFYSHASCEA